MRGVWVNPVTHEHSTFGEDSTIWPAYKYPYYTSGIAPMGNNRIVVGVGLLAEDAAYMPGEDLEFRYWEGFDNSDDGSFQWINTWNGLTTGADSADD